MSPGGTIHVDASAPGANDGTTWENAYTGLQTALAASADMPGVVEIWVADGTYTPTVPNGARTATFQLHNNVEVYGGFAGNETTRNGRNPDANVTILSGDLNDDDFVNPGDGTDEIVNRNENSLHVVTGSDTDASAILDGFTIRHGFAHRVDVEEPLDGGGMRIVNGSPTIVDCTFVENAAGKFGGAVYCEDGDPTLTNCTFRLNWAEQRGGAAYSLRGTLTMRGSTFDENKADNQGGAVHARLVTDLIVENCQFTENRAIDAGGAIFSDTSTATVADCTFTDNSSVSSGGAVYVTLGEIAITDCTLSGNNARNDGGAIFNNRNDAEITGCRFIGNSATATDASDAGAVYNSEAAVAITNCTFSANSATTSGGALFNALGNVTILNATFFGNSAQDGGGIYNGSGNPRIMNCVFSGNSAIGDSPTGNGGAMYNSNSSSRPAVTNCTFSANTADTAGGGIFNNSAPPVLANCILWGNTADGATDEAAQIDGGTPSVDYCCVQGLSGGLGGDGNIDQDPTFVSVSGADGTAGTDDDNLRLSAGSPCIDAGDNNADTDSETAGTQPLPDTDLDGNARLVDDAATADTGNGTAPIVDMGAYELQG